MVTKCEAGGTIDVALKSGTTLGLVCSKRLDPLRATTDGFSIAR